MKTFRIVAAALAVLLLSSCGRGGKIIPRGKMAKIYAEMFIADYRINNDRQARRAADTANVYAPIFKKYGYTVEDYRASVAHYVKDPDRYARILRNTASSLETEIRALKKEKEMLEEMERLRAGISRFDPERIYWMTGLENPDLFTEDSLRFYVDSTGGELYFDVRVWMDTAFFGPEMRIAERDTLSPCDSSAACDSVALPVPSAERDSLAEVSAARRDSVPDIHPETSVQPAERAPAAENPSGSRRQSDKNAAERHKLLLDHEKNRR